MVETIKDRMKRIEDKLDTIEGLLHELKGMQHQQYPIYVEPESDRTSPFPSWPTITCCDSTTNECKGV